MKKKKKAVFETLRKHPHLMHGKGQVSQQRILRKNGKQSTVKPRKFYHRNQSGGSIFKNRDSKSRERATVPKL